MNDWKPTVLVPVVFKKDNEAGIREIRLTLLRDNSVYFDGAEELIFDQGSNPLKTALEYLERNGYTKTTD